MPTLRKFFKHFAPRLMGSSGGASEGFHSAPVGTGRKPGHASRSHYEQPDEMEMKILNGTGDDKSENESLRTERAAHAM